MSDGRTKYLVCIGTSIWRPEEMRSVRRDFFGNLKKKMGTFTKLTPKRNTSEKSYTHHFLVPT
jgi:hypothetical protein